MLSMFSNLNEKSKSSINVNIEEDFSLDDDLGVM